MAETHLWMLLVPLAANLWWTKGWLMDPIIARWRFAVSAFSSAILWVYLAYTSTRVVSTSGGAEIIHDSLPLAYFCAFMAVVSVAGLVLGLFLWTEEEAEEAARLLPDSVNTGFDRARGD